MPITVPEPSDNLIAEGTYEVLLRDGGYLDVTKGGTAYLNIPMIIRNDVNQKYKNMYIWDAIWVNGKQAGIDYKLRNICPAIGVHPGTNFDTWEDFGAILKGKVLRVTIKHGEYNGQPQAQISGYAKTQYPEVKHVFKTKTDVRVQVDPADFEEIDVDDGDMPF